MIYGINLVDRNINFKLETRLNHKLDMFYRTWYIVPHRFPLEDRRISGGSLRQNTLEYEYEK